MIETLVTSALVLMFYAVMGLFTLATIYFGLVLIDYASHLWRNRHEPKNPFRENG